MQASTYGLILMLESYPTRLHILTGTMANQMIKFTRKEARMNYVLVKTAYESIAGTTKWPGTTRSVAENTRMCVRKC